MGKLKGTDYGTIYRVAGPVVTAVGIRPKMYDVVFVGEEGLMGEVIQIEKDNSIIQVYEDTSGIKPGERVVNTGLPLVVELGPGLLTSIYDGIQRPLPILQEKMGNFITRGAKVGGIDRERIWKFNPAVKKGDKVSAGSVLGTVQETGTIEHRIMVPPNLKGELEVAETKEGEFTVVDTVCTLTDGTKITMLQRWPVRLARPSARKLPPEVPLITGQRILDSLFPLAKGGTAAIPGGFGTGKTVTQHQLAKWSDAKIVVYVGCGERGNEMTDVLYEFPELNDPQTDKPLMERTVLIANTSNMPVAAREASVYTGITIAEYYRDMGYDVALMADSTSRWAEAMREISSRLEEMPGEEGYPAYLASRLSQFYERAGHIVALNGKEGSITVIGAVSPPGGDFSEPVTQNTLRIVKVFWALDSNLKNRRHFPAINWLQSYSLYTTQLDKWFSKEISNEWKGLRAWTMDILQQESELQDIVQLVGSDSLPEDQRLVLEIARMIREYFLQQNALHEVDSYCDPVKQYQLLRIVRYFNDMSIRALSKDIPVSDILKFESRHILSKLKFELDFENGLDSVRNKINSEFKCVGVE